LDVFNVRNVEALTLHRPKVDLAIELQEGKQLPYNPLYPLSSTELEVLRQWLEEQLQKGFI